MDNEVTLGMEASYAHIYALRGSVITTLHKIIFLYILIWWGKKPIGIIRFSVRGP